MSAKAPKKKTTLDEIGKKSELPVSKQSTSSQSKGVFGNPLFLIILVAFALRAGFAVYWHNRTVNRGDLFALGDSHSYWTLAEQIAEGKSYEYGSENARIFRTPLLPLFLTPFAFAAGSSKELEPQELTRGRVATAVLGARLCLCLFGTSAVWFVMLIACRLGGTCAGYAAGCLAAVYPSAIGMSVTILSEAIFLPLMCANIYAWQTAWVGQQRISRVRWALISGILAGLAVLARPSWSFFVPFLFALGFFLGPKRKRHLTIAFLSMVAFSLTMSPWWIRNAVVTGKFVPTTLQVGPSLYDGLNPDADGSSGQGMRFMATLLDEQLEADAQAEERAERLESTLEFRLNRRAIDSAVTWARDNPARVAQLAWAKLLRTWSLWPDGGEAGSRPMRLGVTIGCFGTLMLAMIGVGNALFPGWRRSVDPLGEFRWQIGVCFIPCLYFTLLHMVFVGSIRYREPAVFLLCTVAGCGLAFLAGCKIGKSSPVRSQVSLPNKDVN